MKLRRILGFLFGWPFSLIALYYVYTLFAHQWSTIMHHGLRINWALGVTSVGISFFYFVFRVIFWEQILPETHHHPKRTAFFWMLSELQRFLPGNIWGQIARMKYFSHRVPEKKTMVKLLSVESYYIVTGSLVISLLALPKLSHFFPVWQWGISVILFIIGILSIFFIHTVPIVGRVFNGISIRKRVLLLTIMSASFFFLGVGSFLAIKSVAPVSLGDWMSVAGIFSLSLLIGYGAVIVPMGLGVREAALIYFLHFFIPLGVVSFAVIVARLVSVIAEAIALFIFGLWQKIHTENVERQIMRHWRFLIVISFFLLYVGYFTCATFAKQDTFFTGRFDLGNADQVVWNSSRGNFFLFTNPNGTDIISRLAFHSDVLMVDLAPFYWIWDDPKMLLLLQTLALGSGGIVIYFLAKKIIQGSNSLPLGFAIAYFLYPAVQYANLYDFHMVTFATPLLLMAWLMYVNKKMWYMVFFLILSGFTKENVWIVSGIIGCYLIVTRQKRWGLLLLSVSLFSFFFFVSYLIPAIRGTKHFALQYYSDFGNSPRSIIIGFLTKPMTVFSSLFQITNGKYLLMLFAPLGFLSLVGFPLLVFASGDFLINLLSNNPNMVALFYQYTTVIVTFIFISAIYGVRAIIRKKQTYSAFLTVYLLVASVLMTFLYGPLPGSLEGNVTMFENALPYRSDVSYALSKIPADATVAATNNLGAHLSHRDYLYTIPTGIHHAQYLAFLLTDWSAQPSLPAQRNMVRILQHDPSYETLFSEKDFYLFKKRF